MAHRKTMRRREHTGHARYLTFSCYHQLPLLANDRIKELFLDRLQQVRRQHAFELFAYVVMPDHVHVLLMPSLPEHPVAEICHALKRPVAQRVIGRWRKLDTRILESVRDTEGRPRFWQAGGGHDRNITDPSALPAVVDYIHHNPVRKDLVTSPVEWPWSSARRYERCDDARPIIDTLPL